MKFDTYAVVGSLKLVTLFPPLFFSSTPQCSWHRDMFVSSSVHFEGAVAHLHKICTR